MNQMVSYKLDSRRVLMGSFGVASLRTKKEAALASGFCEVGCWIIFGGERSTVQQRRAPQLLRLLVRE